MFSENSQMPSYCLKNPFIFREGVTLSSCRLACNLNMNHWPTLLRRQCPDPDADNHKTFSDLNHMDWKAMSFLFKYELQIIFFAKELNYKAKQVRIKTCKGSTKALYLEGRKRCHEFVYTLTITFLIYMLIWIFQIKYF